MAVLANSSGTHYKNNLNSHSHRACVLRFGMNIHNTLRRRLNKNY